MKNKPIKAHLPNKISESYVYELIKGTGLISTINGCIYIEEIHNVWRSVSDSEAMIYVRDMFEEEWQPYLKFNLIERIIKGLKTDPDLQGEITQLIHEDLVMLENGVWNIAEKKLLKEVNDIKFARVVNAAVSEDMNLSTPVFDRFCKKVFNEEAYIEKRKILLEIIGYSISDIGNVKKAILLLGPSNCGKSVILRFIQRLVGEQNVSNISLSSFSERFTTVEMLGKALNISGEIPSGSLSGRALDIFKSITGGDRMDLSRKGRNSVQAKLRTKLIFAGNTIPTFSKIDGSHSLVGRIHLLLFDNEVAEVERDIELEDKLWAERNEIVYGALFAVADFLENKKVFRITNDELKVLDCMSHVTNPVSYFIEECVEFDDSYMVHITDVYEAYLKFIASEALPGLDRVAFRNLMSMQKGIEISKTKKRLGKSSPKVCFSGIRLKETVMYDKEQDSNM